MNSLKIFAMILFFICGMFGGEEVPRSSFEMIYKLRKMEVLRTLFEFEKERKLLLIALADECAVPEQSTDSPDHFKLFVRGSIRYGQTHPLDVLPKEYVDGYFVEKSERLTIVCPEEVKKILYQDFHGPLSQTLDVLVRELERNYYSKMNIKVYQYSYVQTLSDNPNLASIHCDSIAEAVYKFLEEKKSSSLSWLRPRGNSSFPLCRMRMRPIKNNDHLLPDASRFNITCIFSGPHWVVHMAPLLPTRPETVILVEEPIHMDQASGSPGNYSGYLSSEVSVSYPNLAKSAKIEADLEIIGRKYLTGESSEDFPSVGQFKVTRIGGLGVLVSAETSQVSNPAWTKWKGDNVPKLIPMKSFPLLEMDVSKEISEKVTIKDLLVRAAGRTSVNKPIDFDDPGRGDDSGKLAVLLAAIPLEADAQDGVWLAHIISSVITRMNLPKIFQIWYLPTKDRFFVSLESKIAR